jgi:acyl-[acyl-carrier-protein]-phospholipid O-acyltransferase / long-chain-fatty-acid--[acyl-carrier-protein] ligase
MTGLGAGKSGKGIFRTGYEEAIRVVLKGYFRTVHRVKIDGMGKVPATYDRLVVVANHASYLDGLIIWTFLRLPFRILVDRKIASRAWLRPFLRNDFVVPIDFMNPYALKDVVHMVAEGLPLLVFPEGRRTSTGSLMKIYDGAGLVALKTEAAILPLYLRGTYDTFFARKHKGRRLFAPVTVTIGEIHAPLSLGHLPNKKRREEATRKIYAMLRNLYVEAHDRPSTIGREFIGACRSMPGRNLFDDSTGGKARCGKALRGAFTAGRCLSRVAEGNVALMLPNLTATAVVFFGLQIYSRVAVFLNYSSGPRALGLAMDIADVGTVVTSRLFLERIRLPLETFGARKIVFIEDLKKEIDARDRILGLFRFLFPGPYSTMRPGGEKDDAVILFTSGTEGVPKGVRLSHENIIMNVHQGLSGIDVTPGDRFLTVLPLFHSFGLTVGTILPILARAQVFFHVSPLHYRVVPELAYDRECTILLATNTFLAGYGRRANPYDFRSLRYVFCGGEPLTDAVFEVYAKIFGLRIMSGYGATECGPIVSMSGALDFEYGTAGTVLPGIEWRLARVEGVDDKGGTVGGLFVHGKNVMKGYLKNESANRKYLVEDGGWYDTGDIVERTEKGSLKIVGRLKRFAKVSGEMISLAAVEEVLSRVVTGRKEIAVLSVSDEKRGESLIAVTNDTVLQLGDMREVLKTAGFPELAAPRLKLFLKEIPKLSTGKVDYMKLKEAVSVAP